PFDEIGTASPVQSKLWQRLMAKQPSIREHGWQAQRGKRTHTSVPRKDGITVEEVIRDIANEEQAGEAGRRDHQSLVSCDFAATNPQVAGQKAHRAHEIERGVDCWQKGYPFGCA